MNKNSGVNVKHIDGIYRSTRSTTNFIQVQLPLETASKVEVTTKSKKLVQEVTKPVTTDKFYAQAVAAFSGNSLPKAPVERLKRSLNRLKSDSEPTIADAIKKAKQEETKDIPAEASQQTSVLAKPIKFSLPINRSRLSKAKSWVQARATSFYATTSNTTEAVKKSSQANKLVTVQAVVIGVLLAALIVTQYNYQHYKTTMAAQLKTEQANSDAQWQQLQAKWQCISTKWNEMQTAPAATNKVQGEPAC